MKEYRNEIIIALVSISGAILATWFFFFSIDEKKITVQSDLFSVVAPNPNALLCINRPSMLSKIILSDDQGASTRHTGSARFGIHQGTAPISYPHQKAALSSGIVHFLPSIP